MALRIGQVTELDHTAEFRNDVQLSHFRTNANLGLINSYMFTAGSFPERKSSAEMLRLLQEAAVEDIENRFVVQATYGRGKSHFGLAVANYFGKPADSPEVELLLKKLEYAYNQPASVEPFRNFKKHRKPYLVLLLRGDVSVNLRDQFFRELETAIKTTETTRGLETPFWFKEALRFLDSLSPEQRERADGLLEPHRLDLPTLREKVEQRETGTYAICVDLFKSLIGFTPDFGGETSLADAIRWVVEELCHEQGLIGGLLILFDEFSEFVRGYSSLHPTGVPLQDLLNGVEENRKGVLFVALSQHEPERVVGNDGTVQYASLTKELTRLPHKNRYWLHSTLEDVLGAYFKPNLAHWQQMLREPGIGSRIANASEMAYEAFADRYKRVLHWSAEEFQEKVTRECFPLHPLTTALLSSVDFEAASTTRSVLGFLTDAEAPLKQSLDAPAILDGRPNWVLPVALVDYFKEMLGEQIWQQYKQIDLPDLTPEQKAVLKAMLLQRAGNIPTRAIGFSPLIAELSGLTPAQAEQALKQLEEQRYIRYDSANRVYSFWAGSNAAIELERLLNQELADLQKRGLLKAYLDEFDTYGQNKVNALFANDKSALYRQYPVSVDWGHPEDWAAQLVVLTRASWNVHTLERLTARYTASLKEMPSCRGLVLLPLAHSQDDLDWFAEQIQGVLDSSARLKSAPLLALIPNRPTPDLIANLQKYALLEDGIFVNKTVKQIGTTVMQEEKDRLAKQIQQTLNQLHKEAALEVPAEARGQIRALSIGVGASDKVERALREVYRIAYHSHPGDFYTHYRSTAPTLRNAVEVLIPVLMTNNLAGAAVGLSKVAKEIVDKFLASRAWQLISPKQQIQPPKATHPHKAWERLEASIPPGKEWTSLKEILLELLNVPYGYDHNSLALLFSAWLGYYRRDLQIAVNGRIVGIDSMTPGSKLKPKDFIGSWASGHLRRKDRKKLLEDIEQAVDRVSAGGLSLSEAESILEKLKASANENDITDPTLLDNARLSVRKLQEGIEGLVRYDLAVKDIEQGLERASIQSISSLLKKIAQLAEPVTVVSALAKPAELRQKVLNRAKELTEQTCQLHERLDDIRQYGRQEEILKRALAELGKLGLAEPMQRVQQALERLQQEQCRLEEDGLLARIRSVDASGNLSKLRRELREIEKYSRYETASVRQAALEKAAVLAEEVKRLEGFILDLDKRLDAVDSAQGARVLQREIIKERSRFEGTPDIRDIDAAEARVSKLIGFFSEVEGGLPHSTEEAGRLINRLTELPSTYEGYLSDVHKQKLEQRIQEVQEHLRVQGEKAREWLEGCRRLAAGEDLRSLEAALSKPHPFLSEEMQPILDELQRELLAKRMARLQEEEVLRRIAAMPTRGPLADLRRRWQELSELRGSERILNEAAKKQRLIEQEMAELEAQAEEWVRSAGALVTSQEVEALRERVNRSLSKYEHTEKYEGLEALCQRCRTVSDLLKEGEARGELHAPEAVQQRIARLSGIKNAPELSEAQRQALDAAMERIKAYQQQREAQAREWLTDQEQALSKAQVQPEALRHKLLQPPAFLPEAERPRLEALRARVEAALERQRREEEIQRSLRALPRATTLRELRAQQQEVGRWLGEVQGPEARGALEAKLAELERQIREVLQGVEAYRSQLDGATEYTQVRRLAAELKDFATRLVGTPEAAAIDDLLSRADRLGEYLESLRTFKPAAVASPAEADQAVGEIEKLIGARAPASHEVHRPTGLFPELSEAHRQVGQNLIAQIRSTVERKRQEARDWLARCRARLASGEDLEALEAEVALPPPFLPEEDRAELASLRHALRQKLDQNARERIEQLFLRMSPSERQACLVRLGQLLQRELA